MKICNRALNRVQITNDDGEVRLCGWQKDGGVIGRLINNTFEEIYNGPAANLIRERHLAEDYSNCNPNACPYVANDNWDDALVEVEDIPRVPDSLYLAYENICNYRCVMCTIPDCIKQEDMLEHERKLEVIDDEIRKVLPYVKHIGANGLGELFVCKHTLQLLSEWEPIADVSECSVSLETNGSLFNETNWNKISNLGKYNLEVAITVLSFNDAVYKELSGTVLPVSNIEENLRFVKSLREQGIINRLELAIVYQDKNFRELPEFAKRCIDEFGADYVRLRPFEPWRDPDFSDWFKDVRNEYHPYHKEFLEVMKHPYLKHPKVHDWGGGKVSGLGPEPYPRTRKQFDIITKIMDDSFIDKTKSIIKTDKIVIYAMHTVGKALASVFSSAYEYMYGIDKHLSGNTFLGKEILHPNELLNADKDVSVIIALERYEEGIIDLLKNQGYSNVFTIRRIINEIYGE